MSWYLATPLVLPFLTAVLAFLFRAGPTGRWISVGGNVLLMLASFVLLQQVLADGHVVGQMGSWPAPFGITLVADYLSVMMVVLTALSALTVSVYAMGDIDTRKEQLGYHALFNLMIGGVVGAFLTGDLFNLYVWFEVMLISSFGLLVLGGSREQIDGAVRYVTLNLISTILFLTSIGLLYGMTGTLNMADIARTLPTVENQGLVTVVAMMFMVAFGVKAAVFPLFFWLPASYHTPAFSVSAVFAGLLTKVGVYALMRMFTLVFNADIAFTHTIMLWVGALSMVIGVLGAAAQNDIRKILSFHSVSQIGYMIIGLALLTPMALVGVLLYLIHHNIVKANLFLIAGVVERTAGSTDLAKIGGLYKSAPLLALLFFVTAFALAGFPPLSGFWAKYVLIVAALDIEAWLVAAVALAVGLLTIFSMTKIWAEAFWKAHPDGRDPVLSTLSETARRAMLLPIATLALLALGIGLFPQVFISFAETAAAQLLDPSTYIAAVLGDLS